MMSKIIYICIAFILYGSIVAQESSHLKRSLSKATSVEIDLSSESAKYNPFFGEGDHDVTVVKGVRRFGVLTLETGGASRNVKYSSEETICYVLHGVGLFRYGKDRVPVSKRDFFYIPAGVSFGFENPREGELQIMVMGYPVYEEEMGPVSDLQIANAEDVPLQVLGQHGPTTQYKLLLGPTWSRRDRLAASYTVTSLFIMDFAPGGTNIPHRHEREEEIYYVLDGRGDMVAGESEKGEEIRHAAKAGDAFFFGRNTLVGFYSGNKEGEEHARILAIRSKYPRKD